MHICNRRGDVSFAGSGENSRLTELFVVTGEHAQLGYVYLIVVIIALGFRKSPPVL